LGGNGLVEHFKGWPVAERFHDDWLRTGDVGRIDADGYLYLVDRLADMVISGGMNVYGIEVEAALSLHPSVAQVAVIGVPDDEWGEHVHAVVVLRDPTAEAVH
jgi:acyl-CoA synthetase (AMP-forming)/AMP-acid ligase II